MNAANITSHPYSVAAEQAVIGGLLLDKKALEKIDRIVSKQDFYRNDHQLIFSAIRELESRNEPFDAVTLSNHLKMHGNLEKAGGLTYLGSLAKDTPSAANIVAYADIVREKSLLRQLQSAGHKILSLTHEKNSAVEAYDEAQSIVFAIGESHAQGKNEPIIMRDLTPDVLAGIEERRISGGAVYGLTTGFSGFDAKTAGLQEAQLIIIAARPSMGKTSIAMNVVEHTVLNGTGALVFSMEMSAKEITERQIATLADVDFRKFQCGDLNDEEWSRVTAANFKLNDVPLFIDDSPSLTIGEVRSKARRLHRKNRIGLIVVDYLQLMTVANPGKNRNDDVTEISKGLKALAKEMSLPVIALSQLNRSVEQRPNKRPIMSDLRESGAIEQDADLIAFIYRDEVYNGDSAHQGIAELIIRKQRNGPQGTVYLNFDGTRVRFSDFTGQLPTAQQKSSSKWRGGFDYESVNQ